MSGKFKAQIDFISKQIDLGAQKIAVLFYRRFPVATFNALVKHPLYQKKDERNLYFANGSMVTFSGKPDAEKDVIAKSAFQPVEGCEFRRGEYRPTIYYRDHTTDFTPEQVEKMRKLLAVHFTRDFERAELEGNPDAK